MLESIFYMVLSVKWKRFLYLLPSVSQMTNTGREFVKLWMNFLKKSHWTFWYFALGKKLRWIFNMQYQFCPNFYFKHATIKHENISLLGSHNYCCHLPMLHWVSSLWHSEHRAENDTASRPAAGLCDVLF